MPANAITMLESNRMTREFLRNELDRLRQRHLRQVAEYDDLQGLVVRIHAEPVPGWLAEELLRRVRQELAVLQDSIDAYEEAQRILEDADS